MVAGTFVTTDEGDSGMFFEIGAGLVTPQISYTVTDGEIYGIFNEASDYQGDAGFFALGSETLLPPTIPLPIAVTGDVWVASGEELTSGGLDLGVSFGLGLQTIGIGGTTAYPADAVIQQAVEKMGIQSNPVVNWFAYEYVPTVANYKFEGAGLLVCRMAKQCGR